jgi:hypothetical protein
VKGKLDEPPPALLELDGAQPRSLDRQRGSGGRHRALQAALRLGIHVCRKWSSLCAAHVFLQMRGTERTNDGGMHLRVRDRVAEQEGRPAFTRREQIVQSCGFPGPPAVLRSQSCSWFTPCHTTADDRAGPSLTRPRDRVLVLRL